MSLGLVGLLCQIFGVETSKARGTLMGLVGFSRSVEWLSVNKQDPHKPRPVGVRCHGRARGLLTQIRLLRQVLGHVLVELCQIRSRLTH